MYRSIDIVLSYHPALYRALFIIYLLFRDINYFGHTFFLKRKYYYSKNYSFLCFCFVLVKYFKQLFVVFPLYNSLFLPIFLKGANNSNNKSQEKGASSHFQCGRVIKIKDRSESTRHKKNHRKNKKSCHSFPGMGFILSLRVLKQKNARRKHNLCAVMGK